MSITKKIIIGIVSSLVIMALAMSIFIMALFSEPDMTDVPDYFPFKSGKVKTKYLEYYDQRSQDWPVPSETKLVTTSFGETFIRISGPQGAPALVLLPSTSSTSLEWIPNIEALSSHFRVYALDNIYDFGRSRNTKLISNPEDMVNWLDELFTELGLIDKINLAGLSFGGWLTSQYVLAHPERLSCAILIAPAATIYNFPPDWAWRGILSALPHRWFMQKFMIEWLFTDLMNKDDSSSQGHLENMVNDARVGLKSFKFRMPVTPTVLSDSELHSISVPTLFMVGENEKLYPAEKAVRRIDSLSVVIRTEIISAAGHDLTIVQSDLVNKLLIDFIVHNNTN